MLLNLNWNMLLAVRWSALLRGARYASELLASLSCLENAESLDGIQNIRRSSCFTGNAVTFARLIFGRVSLGDLFFGEVGDREQRRLLKLKRNGLNVASVNVWFSFVGISAARPLTGTCLVNVIEFVILVVEAITLERHVQKNDFELGKLRKSVMIIRVELDHILREISAESIKYPIASAEVPIEGNSLGRRTNLGHPELLANEDKEAVSIHYPALGDSLCMWRGPSTGRYCHHHEDQHQQE